MVRRTLPPALVAALAIALVAGCSKSPTSPTSSTGSTDQAQVVATLAVTDSLTDDGLAESTLHAGANGLQPAGPEAGPASIQAAILPYAWWQDVSHVSRTWTFAFADTDSTGHPAVCVATLTKHVTGNFVIVPASDTTTTIQKPLDKTYTRQVMLQRLLLDGMRVWKVIAVTGEQGSTPAPNNTSQIVSIRIVATGVDTTITDPTGFFSLRHVLKFAASDSVHVTVTTTAANDPVFIHLNGVVRWRLRNNLDNTYSTAWQTSAWGGWRHFGIQVMTYPTLYDDAAAVDTRAWHFPFRVLEGDLNYYP